MRPKNLRTAALMIIGALVLVQGLVTVLEARARPAGGVDPAFMVEMQQAQATNGTRYLTSTQRR